MPRKECESKGRRKNAREGKNRRPTVLNSNEDNKSSKRQDNKSSRGMPKSGLMQMQKRLEKRRQDKLMKS